MENLAQAPSRRKLPDSRPQDFHIFWRNFSQLERISYLYLPQRPPWPVAHVAHFDPH